MPNYNSNLQINNAGLQEILNAVNELPDVDGIQLPELTNEGSSFDLRLGKQLIDSEGNVVVGTVPINVITAIKDVCFYDYDGTLLYSYTIEEAQALTELPALPSHPGLICQGWNYDLKTIKSYNRAVNVGAIYVTDDGKTRLYIRIEAEGRTTVSLYFSQTIENGVVIDWGDGSATQTLSGTGVRNPSHTYSSIGDYVISFGVTRGRLSLGRNGSVNCLVTSYTNNFGLVYRNMLRKVELSSSVEIEEYAFRGCDNLTSITIPNNAGNIGANAFHECRCLTSINIPSSMESINNKSFAQCYGLVNITIPDSTKTIWDSAFYYCSNLAKVTIPNGVETIKDQSFSVCASLANIAIPPSVTNIGNKAFSSCFGMAIYDFTSHTSVPTLSNVNAFDNIPSDCIIKVPAALYDEWIAATNWSTYADYIVAV